MGKRIIFLFWVAGVFIGLGINILSPWIAWWILVVCVIITLLASLVIVVGTAIGQTMITHQTVYQQGALE